MHIPVKVDYGVRALVDLAARDRAAPVRASEIAARTMIPEAYLAQVLHALGKAGMVKSQRGPQGGHALAADPNGITLSMVMECLGPGDNLVACLNDLSACVHSSCCAQREVWREVEMAVERILQSHTIGDLAGRSRGMQTFIAPPVSSAPPSSSRVPPPSFPRKRESRGAREGKGRATVIQRSAVIPAKAGIQRGK